MFESHFQLKQTPFTREISVQGLFLTKSHQEALSRLRYTAERRGVMLLCGDSGVGKSTVLRRFKHDLDPTHFEVLYFNQTGGTVRSFYADLLGQLRLEVPYQTVQARTRASAALLERYQTHRRIPVLLLDEAQEMPDTLLEHIRGLLNYECDAFSPFALALSGTRRLSRRLALQHHEALAGRIQLQFHLAGLTPDETVTYVTHQLELVGADRPIFTASALRKLHQASNGNPRAVNKLATLSLMSAAAKRLDLIDDDLVGQLLASEVSEP